MAPFKMYSFICFCIDLSVCVWFCPPLGVWRAGERTCHSEGVTTGVVLAKGFMKFPYFVAVP